MASFTEGPAYPSTAKYYLRFEGFQMDTASRSSPDQLTPYQKLVMEQLYRQSRTWNRIIQEDMQ